MSLPSLQLKKFPGALWALGAGCQTKEKHWEQLARLGIEILPRSFVLPWDPSQWAGRWFLIGPRCWQSGTLPAAQRAASAGTPVCRRVLPGLAAAGNRAMPARGARCRAMRPFTRNGPRGPIKSDHAVVHEEMQVPRAVCTPMGSPQRSAASHPIPSQTHSPGVQAPSLCIAFQISLHTSDFYYQDKKVLKAASSED